METNNTPDKTPDKTPRRTPKRRTGGQPGNTNARKHGFYSSFLLPKERRKLKEASRIEGLDNEISIMRYKLGRMVEDPNVSTLEVGRVADVIARVTKVQRKYFGQTEDDIAVKLAGVVNSFSVALGLGEFADGMSNDGGAADDGEPGVG